MSQNRNIAKGFAWKLLERFGVLGAQFLLQIILARILDPGHYGVLSLMTIFTALANAFIQHGLNTALVQNKDVTQEDYSSVFWVNMVISLGIYILLFFGAPLIADFYDMPEIIVPFRVLCLMLIPGAVNAIQLAKVRRAMNFKKVFQCNVVAIVVSGVVGIAMAYAGAGIWALVAQTVLNVAIATVVMWFTVDFRPKFVYNAARVKVLFSFGWKLTLSSLINTLYQDLRSLVIGKKYSSDILGHYNRGKQFPQFLNSAVNSAVQSVLLPAMSAEQSDRAKLKKLMRNSVSLSSYILFPLMAGLAGVAAPLVELLLTDKWLPCVPYLQIYCFTFAFYPIHTSNLQAINAVGRSDVYLYLEIIKKIQGIVMLVAALLLFDSPIAIALTGLLSTVTSSFINAYPNKKLIGYSYFEQMKDLLPSMLTALVMFGVVLSVQLLQLPALVTMVLQALAGVAVYVGLSAVLRLMPFRILLSYVKNFRKKPAKVKEND